MNILRNKIDAKMHGRGPSWIVIQSTSFCNLDCNYCYLKNKNDTTRMSAKILTKIFKLVDECNELNFKSSINWHQGEPLSVGPTYFKNAINLMSKHVSPMKLNAHSIQTNGTLIDSRWISLFKKYPFEIGISVDGPAFIHNRNRLKKNGNPSHELVMKGINLLKENGIKYTGICVLTNKSLDYPDEIFDFFLKNQFKRIGFNIDEIEGVNKNSSFKNSLPDVKLRYKVFMTRIFERWLNHQDDILIREFNGILSQIHYLQSYDDYCAYSHETQDHGFIIFKRNGDIVPFSPGLVAGSELDESKFVVSNVAGIENFMDIFNRQKYKGIRNEILAGRNACRKTCEYFRICGGGSPTNKYFESGRMDIAETTYCTYTVKLITDVVKSCLQNFGKCSIL